MAKLVDVSPGVDWDRLLARLRSTDWADLDRVHAASQELIDLLTDDPGLLSAAIGAARADERLMVLSERMRSGMERKLVLHDEGGQGFRIRILQRTAGASSPLHSHRWAFSTRVLAGSYEHLLFATDQEIRARGSDTARPKPLHRRVERRGASYAMNPEMVHQVTALEDELSLMVRGPVTRDQALIIWADTGRMTPLRSATAEDPKVVRDRRLGEGEVDGIVEQLRGAGYLG